MTNSEARKRAQETAQAAPAIHQRPASVEMDPSATAPPVGPQIASHVVARQLRMTPEVTALLSFSLPMIADAVADWGELLQEVVTAETNALLAELDRLTAALAAERARVAAGLALADVLDEGPNWRGWGIPQAIRLALAATTAAAPTTESKEDDHA